MQMVANFGSHAKNLLRIFILSQNKSYFNIFILMNLCNPTILIVEWEGEVEHSIAKSILAKYEMIV